MKEAMNWHKLNEAVASPEKVLQIFFGLKEDQELNIDINGDVTKNFRYGKTLGYYHCQKTNNKVRVVRGLEHQKASLLYNSFMLTNFNHL